MRYLDPATARVADARTVQAILPPALPMHPQRASARRGATR
jgi:hypothetical protein